MYKGNVVAVGVFMLWPSIVRAAKNDDRSGGNHVRKSEKDQKMFQSYLDNIKAKTGKTPDDFRELAAEKGLTKNSEIVGWLKSDFELGHGHANAIAH